MSSTPVSNFGNSPRAYVDIWVLSAENIVINATNAENVSIDTNVIVDFEDEINISTVDGNITLKEQETGLEVNGSFSYEDNNSNTSVIFTPDESLIKETVYDFTITVYVENVTGYAYFSSAYTISFTTEKYLNGTISGFILDASNGTGIAGVNVSAQKSTLKIWTLSGAGGYYNISVPPNDNYTVQANGENVHYDISSVTGVNVTEEVTLENINISLVELPQNVEVYVKTRIDNAWYDAQGATEVLLSTDIRIGFYEPMIFDSAKKNITLLKGNVEVPGNLTSADNTTFYFNPTEDLSPDSNYLLNLSYGIMPMNTSHESPLWRDISFEFTTRSDPIKSVTPSPGAINIAIDTVITVTFSYDINASKVGGGITVDDEDGNSVDGTVTYDNTTFTATFTPDNYLKGSTEYTIYLSDIILDLNGLTIFPPDDFPDMYEWSFTTRTTQGLLNITVTDKALTPLFGVTLTITKGSFEIDTQYTTSNGMRSFQLQAGTYNVTASLAGYQIVTESDVIVTAGGVKGLAIILSSETGSLVGTVKDTEGNPLVDVTIVVKQDSNVLGTDNTDVNGAYEITNLYPGSYNITATAEGFNEIVIENVQINSDQITTKSFNIEKSAPPPDDDDDEEEIEWWLIGLIIIVIIIVIIIIIAALTMKRPEVEEEEEAEPSYGAPRAERYEPSARPSPISYRELEERAGAMGEEPGKPRYYGRCPECMHLLIGSPECFHCAVRATYEVQEPPYVGYYE
jgi:hypothetical protein